MAPNSTDISLPSNKSTPSKRRIKTNNTTNAAELRFTEETWTIIQYAIYSLLGRPTNSSPGPVAIRFRELVSGILKQHDVYSSLCVNLQLSPLNFEHNFHGVAESIFEDRQMNWGRLIALVGFSVKAAEYFRSYDLNETQDDIVVELTSNFIVRKAETWILSRGGWKDVVAHFANTRCDSGQCAARNDGWLKGILVTATATIGLGALFAVTCK